MLKKRLSDHTLFKVIAIGLFVLTLIVMRLCEPQFQAAAGAGVQTLDMRFGYTAEEVYHLLDRLGITGREVYVTVLLVDFIFIVSFALTQNMLLKWLMGERLLNSCFKILLSIAFVRGGFDVLENIFILIMLSRFPTQLPWLATVSGIDTQIKFIILYLWLAAVPIAFIIRMVLQRRQLHA